MKILRHATLFVSTLLVVTLVEGAQHFVPPPGATLVASPAVAEQPVAPPAVVAPAVVSPPSNTVMSRGDSAKKQAILTGLLLALNSGYINGCCLSGGVTGGVTKQAVAAVTGAYTVSATQAAAGNFAAAAFQLKVLASFISGSAISGFLNPSPTTFAVASSMKTVFLLGSFLLFVASWAAGKDPNAKYFFYLAAIANGMQNSMTSTYTANLCRTTHYTVRRLLVVGDFPSGRVVLAFVSTVVMFTLFNLV
jgi:hypothetical protein